MFTVSVKEQDVIIMGMDIISRRNVTSNITIYTKSGKYYNGTNSLPPIEHVLRADEWEQIYLGTISAQPHKLVALNDFPSGSVSIRTGQTQSFYVFVSNGMLYTAGEAADAPMVGVVAEDVSIVIHEGQVMRGLFQKVAYRGKWGGVMRYRTVS